MKYQITFPDGTSVFQTIDPDDPYLEILKAKYKVKEIYTGGSTCISCEG